MAKYIARRLLLMVLTMLIVSAVVFVLAEVAPGDVARRILGPFATPEQEDSFRRQLGLDQPLHVRYFSFLAGTDWQAAGRIGMPLRRLQRPGADHPSWWAVEEDGTPIRWRLDGEDLIAQRLQEDGSIVESVDNARWTVDEDGVSTFWGVDNKSRAVLWEKGGDQAYWTRAQAAGWWVEGEGGAIRYIPLQRGLLRGDPGISVQTGRPVATTLFRRLRNSAILAGLAFAIVMPFAVFMGLVAGLNEGKLVDRALSTAGLIGTSMPEFATGIFLILILAIWLGWVPGVTAFPDDTAIFRRPDMLVLPVLTLTIIEFGYVLRITRASMVEVMGEDYIRTAFLKGLPYRRVVLGHALRNALLAPITVIMLHVNWLMGGLVVVEAIFGFPGLGRYIYDAGLQKDVFALQGGALVMVFLAVGTQLIADILYRFLNPRIRYS